MRIAAALVKEAGRNREESQKGLPTVSKDDWAGTISEEETAVKISKL